MIWVEGNHDENLRNCIPSMFNISAVKEFIWSSKGKNLLALHGHQFDDYTRHKNYLATIASKIYKCLRSIDFMLNRDIFHPLCYGNKSCQRLSELVNERALEYAKKHNVDYVFCGHSHRATNVVKDGVQYFNTRCWNDR